MILKYFNIWILVKENLEKDHSYFILTENE